jgi:sec-independent protein translocase protein TatB
MLNIGPQELILILIVALIVVGPARLPELGRSIGKVLREFRKIQDDVKDTIKFDLGDDEPYVPPVRRSRPAIRNGGVTRDTPAEDAADTGSGSEPDPDAEPRAAE